MMPACLTNYEGTGTVLYLFSQHGLANDVVQVHDW